MSVPLLIEQHSAAIYALSRARVKKSDTQVLTVVAGIMPHAEGQRFAFCPTEVRPGIILKKGDEAKRGRPLCGRIEVVNHRLVASQLLGYKGFVRLKCELHWPDGPVLVPDLKTLELFELPAGVQDGVTVTQSGRPYAAQLLTDKSISVGSAYKLQAI